jgi:hypothetical protein
MRSASRTAALEGFDDTETLREIASRVASRAQSFVARAKQLKKTFTKLLHLARKC